MLQRYLLGFAQAMMSSHNAGKRLVLILGGARSGKSSYAEELARYLADGVATVAETTTPTSGDQRRGQLIYVATAAIAEDDEEMSRRITDHQRARGGGWLTIEEPYDPGEALEAGGQLARPGTVALVDCLTLLVSNVLLGDSGSGASAALNPENGHPDWPARERRVEGVITRLLAAYQRGAGSLILVSNEVGMGLVPPYPLGREYRDVLGRTNARIAQEADVVLFMLAGLPVEVKSLAKAWNMSIGQRLGLDQ
jgi:adenosylcobinamide kinase / adenosylcobinamide-phosphate guanylyltransferase